MSLPDFPSTNAVEIPAATAADIAMATKPTMALPMCSVRKFSMQLGSCASDFCG